MKCLTSSRQCRTQHLGAPRLPAVHAPRTVLRPVMARAAQQQQEEGTLQKAAAIILTAGLSASLALAPAVAAKSLQDKAAEQERAYQEQLRKMELALEKWERAQKDKVTDSKPAEAPGVRAKAQPASKTD